jgi:hypothetical protein
MKLKKKCPDCGKMLKFDDFYLWGGDISDYHCKKCHDIKFDGHKMKSREKIKLKK